MTRELAGLDVTSAQLTLATVWQIRRKDDTVFGFTDHDVDLVRDLGNGNGSVVHLASTGFARSALATAAGIEVPQMETSGILSSTGISAADLRAGLFRGAEVWIGQVDWTGGAGLRKLQRGWIGDLGISDFGFTAELVGLTAKLVQSEMVEHYTVECNADFGDARCGLEGDGPCDKQYTTCRDTFDNLANFRGHAILMPGTDVMLRYPLRPAEGTL